MGELITLPVSEWRPDLPALAEGSAVVKNVVPRTEVSYGPMSTLSAYATAPLSARCQGAFSGLDPSGAVHIFAATASDIYRMVAGTSTFARVSKSAAAYDCQPDQFWRFAVIKDRVVACNITDPMQSFRIGTDSSFSYLSPGAPKARYITGVRNWLMAAFTNDPTGGVAPWRVWWSAINDATNWPTPGSDQAAAVQSDYNDTVGDGGWIQGIVGNLGTADVAIFFEHSIWRGAYVGPPAIFDFAQAVGAKGTPAPHSVVQLGGLAYYLGEDGWYSFDGSNIDPIGFEKVDKTFFADVDQAYLDRVIGTIDPLNKLLIWIYPGAGNSQGVPNRMLVYHWQMRRWATGDQALEYVFRALSFGYTLEGFDSTGYDLDTLPASLDSRVWSGGSLVLAGFDQSHTFGYFTGPNLAPIVDTREVQPFAGQLGFVSNTRPVVDGGSPGVALATRNLQTDNKVYGVQAAMNSLGYCPLRGTGRYLTGRISLPAASGFTHISGLELDASPAGSR